MESTMVADRRLDLLDTRVKLNISLKPSPKNGVGIKGVGKISLSLKELTKPLKLGGTLADPSLALDTTQTAITRGKAAGGFLLAGPVGLAAALANVSVGDKNPCLAALEAANKEK